LGPDGRRISDTSGTFFRLAYALQWCQRSQGLRKLFSHRLCPSEPCESDLYLIKFARLPMPRRWIPSLFSWFRPRTRLDLSQNCDKTKSMFNVCVVMVLVMVISIFKASIDRFEAIIDGF
jgi:hypothetical protein